MMSECSDANQNLSFYFLHIGDRSFPMKKFLSLVLIGLVSGTSATASESDAFSDASLAPCKIFAYMKSMGVFAPEKLQEIAEQKGYELTVSTDDADYILEWKITLRKHVTRDSSGAFVDTNESGESLYEFFGNVRQVSYRQSVKDKEKFFKQIDVLAPLYGFSLDGPQATAISQALKDFPNADPSKCGRPATYVPRE